MTDALSRRDMLRTLSAVAALPRAFATTAVTTATVTVTATGIAIDASVVTIGSQSAALQIAAAAPGLFTLNTAGLAAAYTIVVGPETCRQ